MIDQEDVDFINDKLYCLSVPDEAIKKNHVLLIDSQ